MSPKSAAIRFWWVCAGYVVACAVAALVTVLLLTVPGPFGSDPISGGMPFAELVGRGFTIGMFWTLMFAWPGFIVAIIIGERQFWSRPQIYALAGLANVIPSMIFFGVAVESPLRSPSMLLASFPGGFAGGAAYWLSVGRIAARYRKAT